MSKKSKIPASFPFWVDDWLSSKHRALMTPAERGAYIDLLAYQWVDPTCTLPDDDLQLSILSGLGKVWKRSASALRKVFVPHPQRKGRVYNKKLYRLRHEIKIWNKAQSEAGKRGGLKSAQIRFERKVASSDPSSDPSSEPTRVGQPPRSPSPVPGIQDPEDIPGREKAIPGSGGGGARAPALKSDSPAALLADAFRRRRDISPISQDRATRHVETAIARGVDPRRIESESMRPEGSFHGDKIWEILDRIAPQRPGENRGGGRSVAPIGEHSLRPGDLERMLVERRAREAVERGGDSTGTGAV